MKKGNKSFRRTMIVSSAALALSFSALIGGTYAWFTDVVTTGTNHIVAGILDVELSHSVGTTYEKVDANTKLFDVKRWVPDTLVYENFKIENVGTVAFDYKFSVYDFAKNYVQYVTGGTEYTLLDVIQFKVIDTTIDSTTTKETLKATYFPGTGTPSYLTGSDQVLVSGSDTTAMATGGSKSFAIVMYWAPSTDATDNLYNMDNGKVVSEKHWVDMNGNGTKESGEEFNELFVDFGIKLEATQTHD